ncbi:MAG: 5-(carboxyamino)imidazole ribonucleotide synthase [Pseudomonadota bacterium]
MRVGVIGGGQLGRMLALAGIPLGMRFRFLDPAPEPCATEVGEHLNAPFDDAAALTSLAADCDLVTCEFENVPATAFDLLAPGSQHPAREALHTAQERGREKACFESVGIPVAPWRTADDQAAIEKAVAELGLPLIAKTRTLGYDGKGQRRLHEPDDARELYESMGGVPLLLERLVDFDRELSVIGTRAKDGGKVIYPLTANVHRNGILHRSEQANVDQALARQATRHFSALTDALGYVGTLAIEFFVSGNLLLGNEFAPRVHNSGHWTQNGMPHGQFENHMRAVAGLPLGGGAPIGVSGMINLIGSLPDIGPILANADAYLHDYGKAPRPGRKLGHVNVVARSATELHRSLDSIEKMLDRDTAPEPQRV